MSITTTSTLPAPVQESFNQKILATPTPNKIHNIPAMAERMPANGGRFIKFRRYTALQAATVPLGNSGVTPPSQNLTAQDFDAEIQFYGTWVAINEQVTLQAQDRPLNQAAIRLGEALRLTEDELTRNMLQSTATVVLATGGNNGDIPTNLAASDVSRVTRTLLSNDGYMFLSTIAGEDRYGTAPVRNAYFALCHTDLTQEFENIPEFKSQSEYANQQRVLESEWGSIRNLRILVSSIGSIANARSMRGANIYNMFCVAKEAYGYIEQDRYSAQFIYRPAIYSDPLAQNVTAGFKMACAVRILNDSWIYNIQSTLS